MLLYVKIEEKKGIKFFKKKIIGPYHCRKKKIPHYSNEKLSVILIDGF